MNARASGFDHASALAQAVLYDGCAIYPYRAPLPESPRPTLIGNLFPQAWQQRARSCDPSSLQLECLIQGSGETQLDIRLCFLHFIRRQIYKLAVPAEDLPDELGLTAVESLRVAGELLTPSDEACDREFRVAPATLEELRRKPALETIAVPPYCEFETVRDAELAVAMVGREAEPLEGRAWVRAKELHDGLWQLTVTLENRTSFADAAHRTREEAQRFAFGMAHAALQVADGSFISFTEPPTEVQRETRACVNHGVRPVLLGAEGASDLLFASPIILPDYPPIAAESTDDLRDTREIDQLLGHTASARGRRPAATAKYDRAAPDHKSRALSSRRNGDARSKKWPGPRLASIRVGERTVALGDRVRLKLRDGSGLMDVVLAGMPAIVAAIERDSDGHLALAVTIEDDPQGEPADDRLAGRRFVYALDEVEPLGAAEAVA